MKAIRVAMKGVAPLLMHQYPMTPIEGLDKMTPEEQAEYSAYRDPDRDGELYIPGVNVQRALINAAAYSKGKGRASLQRVAAASIFVSPMRLGLGTRVYEIDSRPVVIAATKGRVMRHRPMLKDGWEISFTLEYDEVLLSEKQVRQIVDDMGSRVGLLDFRPEKKGAFGRCMVTGWEPVNSR